MSDGLLEPKVNAPDLRVRKHATEATLPTRGSPYAAGYDIYSTGTKIVPARGRALIDTRLSIAVPKGTYGRIAPRSGLASKFGIHTGAGVIDEDYRGVVYVLLFNLSDQDFGVVRATHSLQLSVPLRSPMTPSLFY